MTFATERTIEVEWGGGKYTVELVMLTSRQKLKCTEANGQFSNDRFFELSVKSIAGPPVNGHEIKTGADVLDTPGTDDLFLRIFREINKWNLGSDDAKNS